MNAIRQMSLEAREWKASGHERVTVHKEMPRWLRLLSGANLNGRERTVSNQMPRWLRLLSGANLNGGATSGGEMQARNGRARQ